MAQKIVRKKSKTVATKKPVVQNVDTTDPLLQDLDDTESTTAGHDKHIRHPQTKEEKISSVEETIARQTQQAASATNLIFIYLPTVLTIGVATFLAIQAFHWLPNLDAYYDDASSRKSGVVMLVVVAWCIITAFEIFRTIRRRRKFRS